FERQIAGQHVKVSGQIVNGLFDVTNESLVALDALVTLRSPLTLGNEGAQARLESGEFHLLIQQDVLSGLSFTNLNLGLTVSDFVLTATANGSLTEAGLSLEGGVQLEDDVTIGTEKKGALISKGANARVKMTNGALDLLTLDTALAVTLGDFKASGTIVGGYDGSAINGTVKATTDTEIGLGRDQMSGKMLPGAELDLTVTNSALTQIAIPAAMFDANIMGIALTGSVSNGVWNDTGVSCNLDLALSNPGAMSLTQGAFSLTPTGGTVRLSVENNDLKSIDVAGFSLTANYQSVHPVSLAVSFLSGTWDPSGLTGSASVSLLAPLTVGSANFGVVMDGGSATASFAQSQIQLLTLTGWTGRVQRNGAELGTVLVNSGEYDFESGDVTQASVSVFMGADQVVPLGPGVFISGVNGTLLINGPAFEVSGGASLTADMGEGRVL
ncbi:MAG: hypothetical protein KC561_19370, partial [Myxococcales bacterium]|nr:hypothetical protein [Myxococcales bacterium]